MNWPNYPRVQLPQFEQQAKDRYYASYNRNFSSLNSNYILPRAISGESSKDFFDKFKVWAVETRNVYIYGPDESGEMKKKFPDLEEWRKMSVKDLKKILGQISERKSGNKAELYQRIMDWLYVGNLTNNLQLPLSQLRSLIPVFGVNSIAISLSDEQIRNIISQSYLQKDDIEVCVESWSIHNLSWDYSTKNQEWKLRFLANGNLDLNNQYVEQFANKIIKLKSWDGTSELAKDDLRKGKHYFTNLGADFQTQEIWEETCRKILLSSNQRLSLKKCEELLGEIPSPVEWAEYLEQDLFWWEQSDYPYYKNYLHGSGIKENSGDGIRPWARMMCLFGNPSIPESFLRKHWKTVNQTLDYLPDSKSQFLLFQDEGAFPSAQLGNQYELPNNPFTRAMHEGSISLNPFITLANNSNLSSDFLEEIIQSPFITELEPTGIGNGIERGKTFFLAKVMDNNQFLSAEFLRKHIYSNSDIHINGFMEKEFTQRVLAQYHLDANLLTQLKAKSDNQSLKIQMPKWSKTISPTGGWEANTKLDDWGAELEDYVAYNPNPETIAYLLSASKVKQSFITNITNYVFIAGDSARYNIARNPSLPVLDIWDVEPVSDRSDWFTIFDEDDIAKNGGLTLPFIINRFTSLARHGNYLFSNPAIFPATPPSWKSGLFNWRF